MALNQIDDGYLRRYVDDELDELLPHLRAISLDGPRGVGKTETAGRRADAILALDDPEVRRLAEADPDGALTRGMTVLLDEWQHLPQLWDRVRRAVDARTDRRYLLAGSAAPAPGTETHTGAGRILSLRMRPMSLAERPGTTPTVQVRQLFEGDADIGGESDFRLADYAREICASGLPEMLALPARARRPTLDAYISRIIDRDVPESGTTVRRPAAMRAWMAAYAAASSTTTDYAKVLEAATPGEADKPSKNTSRTYRETLTRLWVLDPVPAWLPGNSPLTRLTQASKHQLADPALAASLLNVSEEALLSGARGSTELFGRLLETLATLTVRAAGAVCEARTHHLRTRGGDHEVDLILERHDGAVVGFEVKLARTVDDADVRHLHWLGEQIGDRLRDKVILTTGSTAYRRRDGVAVVPLALLG